MIVNQDTVTVFVFFCMMASWLAFALIFLFRKRPLRATPQRRNFTSLIGIALVGIGCGVAWNDRRPMFTPMFPSLPWRRLILAPITVTLGAGSVWLVLASVRTLGSQSRVTARLVDNHRLVKEGPYSAVRHPIYVGMLGLIVATGLALCTWQWCAVATILGWYGNVLRIGNEEKLLREAFGEEFEVAHDQDPDTTFRAAQKTA
jgi:protein-S-isoprenylcysteine O-methyltransferase Ste14